jgi:DNA sulfur modification protein DndB
MKLVKDIKIPVMAGCLQFPALKYKSGGRTWLAITVQYKVLGKFITTSQVKKKNQEIINSELINRFLDSTHKNDIKRYIREEEQFTLPPITLVSYEELIFDPITLNEMDDNLTEDQLLDKYGSLTGVVFIPVDYEFLCMDGNHRTAAIRELASENPEFIEGSSMLLNIVFEKDKRKIRQDFVDVNKNAKSTTPSINTLFNTRDPLSAVVADLLEEYTYLKDSTELLANSISKNSKCIYTINNLKNAVVELSGTHSSSTASINKVSRMLKEDAQYYEEIKKRTFEFFNLLEQNFHIKECLSGFENVPSVRSKSIITSGSGLVVCTRVAGKIYSQLIDEVERREKVMELVKWDWSRNNPFFKGVLVNEDGGITPGQTVFTSIAKKLAPYFIKEVEEEVEEKIGLFSN